MDVLARWRWPEEWRRPGRVALANVPSVHPDDLTHKALLDGGVELVATPLRDGDGRVAAAVAESDVVVSGGAGLDRDFFASLRDTRLLLRPYVGYDDIDVDAATEHGVLVANVPDAFVEEVANHAMALILATNRWIVPLDRYVRDGGWARNRQRSDGRIIRRPSAQTLGLIGFGNIARLVATRAQGFGFRMVAYDPYVPDDVAREHGVALVPLDELLRQSDVVSVHVLLNEQTRHLLGAEQLALMKPTAWFINTSRGPVVDEAALIAALREGRIAGAGLDVFEVEPLAADSPLMALDNVVLSPHVAAYSEEGVLQQRRRTAEIALQVALGGLPQRHVVIDRGFYDRLAAMPELAGVARA